MTVGTLVLVEIAARIALPWVPEPEARVRFAFEEVWSHGRNPFHTPDRDLLWRMIPGYSEGLIRINDEGFRGPTFARDKPVGTYRVVVLGDSVTFGYGVAEDATYARQLERLLDEAGARGGGNRAEVINAGVIGYTSWQGRLLYERTVGRFAPDLVVVLFGYNDHHSAVQSDAQRYGRRHLAAIADNLAATGAFRLLKRVCDRVAGTDLRRAPVPRVSVNDFEANLLALRQRAEADGARTLFLTVPVRQTLPLVENFRAVDYDEDDAPRRVWMRQIDFAVRLLGPVRGAEIRRHFLDGRSSLTAFAEDAAACARVRGLATRYPEFAIFWYLSAACGGPGRDAALARAEAADSERRELEAYNGRLAKMVATSGLDVLDVAQAFRTGDSRALLGDVVHPTHAGHTLIARLLAGRIMAR